MNKLADGPYQPSEIEENILSSWLEHQYYKPEKANQILKEQQPWRGSEAGEETFTIVNPPPNAYARPHMGNVSGYAYQDLFGRRARMQGKTTLLFPGKDHAAQQAEIVYIREVLAPQGKKREDFTREEFYRQAYEYFTGIMRIAQEDEKRIGLSADFGRDLFTLDPRVASTIYDTFSKLWRENMVYKGVRIVNWSPGLNSAVADIDTERKTVESTMYYIKYAIPGTASEVRQLEERYRGIGKTEVVITAEPSGAKVYKCEVNYQGEKVNVLFYSDKSLKSESSVSVIVEGLAVGSGKGEDPYLVGRLETDDSNLAASFKDKRYAALFKESNIIIGSAFIKLFREETPNDQVAAENFYSRGLIIGTVRPETVFGDTAVAFNPKDDRFSQLEGQDLLVTGLNGETNLRMIADQSVDPDFGTGLLKVTPAHAPTDYEIYLRYNAEHSQRPIGYKNAIGKDSRLNHMAGMAEGLHAEEDRQKVVQLMLERGLIVFAEPIESNIIICERTKTVIQPIMSSQWFVDTDKLKLPALEAVRSGKIKIHPEYMTKKLEIWLDNLRDWPISRSIWWGYRIPVWYKGEITESTDKNGQLVVEIGGQAIQDMQDGIKKGLIKLKLDEGFKPILIPGLMAPENSTLYKDIKLKYPGAQIINIPSITNPKYKEYEQALQKADFTQARSNVVVAHSLGAAAILDYLVDNKIKIKHLILLAPTTLASGNFEKWKTNGFWKLLDAYKQHEVAEKITIIHSDNDETVGEQVEPYNILAEMLAPSPELILEPGKQHFLRLDYRYDSAHLLKILEEEYTLYSNRDDQELSQMQSDGWQQDTDVFDTWFSSGQWPFATLAAEGLMQYYPTSVMETGFDILELWVSRMIMLGIYTQGDIPFQNVYLHGLIKAEDGQKMSKSKGNVVYTSHLIAEYGADALRMMYIVGNKAGASYRIDRKKLTGYRNFLNKIWNASKFILNNLANELTPSQLISIAAQVKDFELNSQSEINSNIQLAEFKNVPKSDIAAKLSLEKVNIDDLMRANLQTLTSNVNNHLDNFRPGMAAEEIYLNFWQLFADIYIEQVKSRLFLYDREGNAINRDDDSQKSRTSALANLLFALKNYLKLLHPFIPFITEHVWQALPEELRESDTIMYSQWPE